MKMLLVLFISIFSMQGFALVLPKSVTPYKTPLAFLATRYRAIHTCNCLFTMKLNEDYCINYSKIEPPIFTVMIDPVNKSVSSGIGGTDFKPSVAKFTSERTGCSLVN